MQNLKSMVLLIALLALNCKANTVESLEFNSAIMAKAIHYAVYLPPDYDTSSRRYPVVVLLHGYTDDESAWIQFGEIPQIADRLIAEGSIAPMIIVMPDGGVTWYMNDYQGKARYEDMMIEEFIPFVDRTYRTRPLREFRAVAGLSMGGYGALLWCLHHPSTFSRCVALSAAVLPGGDLLKMDEAAWDKRYGDLIGRGLKGQARMTKHLSNQLILDLVKSVPVDSMKKIAWYIDCGDDDFLSRNNSLLHIAFLDQQVPHEFRMRDGKHTWSYWRSGIVEGLIFISQGFHR